MLRMDTKDFSEVRRVFLLLQDEDAEDIYLWLSHFQISLERCAKDYFFSFLVKIIFKKSEKIINTSVKGYSKLLSRDDLPLL